MTPRLLAQPAGAGPEGDAASRPRSWSAAMPRSTSSTRRPARSMSRPATRSPQAVLDQLEEAGIDELPTLAIDHVNVGPYIRNTLAVDKNAQPRRGADRHLPRHAPGRAADARDGRDPVPGPVLRPRALRPLGGRPRQDELAPRPRGRARHASARCARRTSSRSSRCWSTSRTAAARSTTSTISATAACARSAS